MKTIIVTKERQKEIKQRKEEKFIHHGKRISQCTLDTLHMLAEKHYCNVEDIEIRDAYYMWVYYLNNKQIYMD